MDSGAWVKSFIRRSWQKESSHNIDFHEWFLLLIEFSIGSQIDENLSSYLEWSSLSWTCLPQKYKMSEIYRPYVEYLPGLIFANIVA